MENQTYLIGQNYVSATIRPKIAVYVGRDADGDITNHIVMARTKTEEKHLNDGPKSPKKKNSIRYSFYFVEKNYNKISLEGKFQNKIRTAVSGTESTIKTDTGKITNRKFSLGPIFQSKKKSRKELALNTTGEIIAKNRHCLRGLDGKYGRWDEILRDILNGKLKIVQNKNFQLSVESTAVFCGIHCKVRMFKVFDSGIQWFAAKFAAEKLPKEWNRLQRNSIC